MAIRHHFARSSLKSLVLAGSRRLITYVTRPNVIGDGIAATTVALITVLQHDHFMVESRSP